MNIPEPKLLRAPQVAALLAISRPAVYRLAKTGKLPSPVKVGNCQRWRKSDIEAVAAGTWKPEPA